MQRLRSAQCAISRPFAGTDERPLDKQAYPPIGCFKNTPWSDEEDTALRDLASAHVTSRVIALTLSRTLAAVRNRARVIGVQLAHASQVGACRRHRRADRHQPMRAGIYQ